jgi:DNA-damage-inducible protein D
MTTKFDLQTFEGLAKENGIRYWDARDFMASLGYDSWASFKGVIKRAMGSCAHLEIGIDDCFIGKTIIEDGKPLDTYKLTRFACLLVTMHADSKKPEVAQAKVALAAIADALIADSISSAALERIEIRTELKAGVTIMTDAAKGAGLQGREYAIFQDAGIRGMYNMSLADLVAHKHAPRDKTLFNYMGKTELAANLFRVTQTAERINNNKAKGLRKVAATATDVGAEVRQVMLKSSGVPPENLSIEEDIHAVSQRIKTTQRAMTRLDAKPKVKSLKGPTQKSPKAAPG